MWSVGGSEPDLSCLFGMDRIVEEHYRCICAGKAHGTLFHWFFSINVCNMRITGAGHRGGGLAYGTLNSIFRERSRSPRATISFTLHAHQEMLEEDISSIENVLAEVCSVCGDALLPLSTIEAIESMLKDPGKPVKTAPVYQMPDVAAI